MNEPDAGSYSSAEFIGKQKPPYGEPPAMRIRPDVSDAATRARGSAMAPVGENPSAAHACPPEASNAMSAVKAMAAGRMRRTGPRLE